MKNNSTLEFGKSEHSINIRSIFIIQCGANFLCKLGITDKNCETLLELYDCDTVPDQFLRLFGLPGEP